MKLSQHDPACSEVGMNPGSSHAFSHRWSLYYEWAIAELDDTKRIHLIALAKGAIFERQRELANSHGHFIDEQHAIQDAIYVLNALRRASEFNRKGK